MKFGRLGTALVFGVAVLFVPLRAHSQTASEELQLSPVMIYFGGAVVGSVNPPRNITITNPTKSNITMERIIPSGINFSQRDDCGQTLAPGVQCAKESKVVVPVETAPVSGQTLDSAIHCARVRLTSSSF